MIAIAYLIPFIACIILRFQFDYSGEWTTFVWFLVAGETTVGAMHLLMYRHYTSARELLGSLVSGIYYEAPWTEVVVRTRTRTDSKGNTYTERYVEHIRHPESYYFINTRGSKIHTGSSFFDNVRDLWDAPRHGDRWSGSNILGDVRYGCHYLFGDLSDDQYGNPYYWVPVTESHRYKNKIRNSNSIFKFERVSRESASALGLIDYPEIYSFDAPCVLSRDIEVPDEVDVLFRKFNGHFAPKSQMRLFILLFDADKGPGISEMQRAYWQGGNKNEFVVCIGMRSDGNVEWARVFSWADDQTIEVETARWLLNHRQIDWQEFYHWLAERIPDWQRKEFADFNYIIVSLPLSHFLIISLVSILENAAAIYLLIR